MSAATAATAARPRARGAGGVDVDVVDVDVHNHCDRAQLLPYLPARWREHLLAWDRAIHANGVSLRLASRPHGSRLDAVPPSGGPPGSDPAHAATQLLDAYNIRVAILNLIYLGPSRNVELEGELMRAQNEFNREHWLAADARWRAAICVSLDDPEAAAREIDRCAARSDRYVQVLIDSHTARPAGNRRYWPVWEAAARHGLPVAPHITGFGRSGPSTGVGEPTYYYELRTGLDMYAQTMVSSLVFEGVFEHLPELKFALTELDWTWAVPFMWRADAAHRVLGGEVPHLRRRPSDYVREHFWWSTQPILEPEHPEQFREAWDQFVEAGLGDKLMYASDYPHWDMDSPFRSLPADLPDAARRQILAGNAAKLYGL